MNYEKISNVKILTVKNLILTVFFSSKFIDFFNHQSVQGLATFMSDNAKMLHKSQEKNISNQSFLVLKCENLQINK